MDSPLLDALRSYSGAGFIDDMSGVSFREAAQIIGSERHAVVLMVKRVENSCADAIHLLSAAAGLCTVAPIHSRWSEEERERFRARSEAFSSSADGGVWMTTSGSSGEPKIVPLSPEKIVAHASAVNEHLGASERDCWLLCLPLFHVGGFAILPRAALAGSTVRLTNSSDAETLSMIIDKEPISLVSLVPTLLRRILEVRKGRAFPERLRAILVGGGPVAQNLIDACPQALATYGMTEAGSMVTCVARSASEAERATAGHPIQGCDVRIVDEAMTDLPSESAGRILIRSQGMAREYLDDATQSAKCFRDGWCVTEDIGLMT
ncbi:AMP-binding protein, partial [bacterium]|nr:AMP-binding protein [bacterium]